jgi:hypothetical protein
MIPKRKLLSATFRCVLATACSIALVPGNSLADDPSFRLAQVSSSQDLAAKIPPDQLDSLVAPIALYPGPMLAQVLATSTYPWK